MKQLLPVLLIIAAAAIPCIAEDTINVGDPESKVLSVLGKPRGKMKKGKTEYWSYMRGVVKVREGKVTYTNIKTEEKALEKEQQRRSVIRSRAEAVEKEAASKKQNIAEGTALRKEKLEDEEFGKLSDEEKLEFWKDFEKKYPDVSATDQISALEKAITPPEPEKTEREILLETIESKQAELDEWVQKAKTTSAGRTWARKYHLAKGQLEKELVELREKLRNMPKE